MGVWDSESVGDIVGVGLTLVLGSAVPAPVAVVVSEALTVLDDDLLNDDDEDL